MTREEAKQLLPILKAFAEGKTIQIQYRDDWISLDEFNFNKSPNMYRIKPESEYRPFKSQEECWNEMLKHQPFGWIKSKKTENLCNISDLYESEGITKIFLNTTVYTFPLALNEFTFADGTPFGIRGN